MLIGIFKINKMITEIINKILNYIYYRRKKKYYRRGGEGIYSFKVPSEVFRDPCILEMTILNKTEKARSIFEKKYKMNFCSNKILYFFNDDNFTKDQLTVELVLKVLN